MTPQAIRELLRQRPFKPFRIIMADGRTFPICHPTMAFPTQTHVLVGTGDAEDNIPDDFVICSWQSVVSVET